MVLNSELVLRHPALEEEEEFLRAHHATSPDWPSFIHYYTEEMPFRRYLERLTEVEHGINLPDGHVPETFLFAFLGPRIVGRVAVRHSLNDFLERVAGHVGYAVVPEFRRRGHATELLRRAVVIASTQHEIRRILVTCDDDNIGSIRTIEKNGGVLENIVSGPDLPKPKRRYWILA